jgi:hypothetical protein
LAGSCNFPTLTAQNQNIVYMKQKFLVICAAAFLFAACGNDKTEGESTTKDSSGKDTKMEKVDDNAKKENASVDPCAGQPASQGDMPMDSAMMKKWGEFMAVGEMQQMLAKSDGEWTGEVTMWMDPSAPPTKSKSVSTNKMILGGRYQHSEHKGCFGGMPFEGVSLIGYDNARKVFMSSWIDNMGTSFMNLEGPWDAATKTVHLKGKSTDAMSGKQVNYREDFTIVDDNNQTLVMYAPDMKGKEFKTMEIKYTRKK